MTDHDTIPSLEAVPSVQAMTAEILADQPSIGQIRLMGRGIEAGTYTATALEAFAHYIEVEFEHEAQAALIRSIIPALAAIEAETV